MPSARSSRRPAPKPGPRPAWTAAALIVVWAGFILAAFPPFKGVHFAVAVRASIEAWRETAFHREFLAETVRRLIVGHAGVLGWAAAVAGLGLPVLGLLRAGRVGPPAERLAFAFGLGFAAGALGWLGAGLVGLWENPVAWAALAAGIALAIRFRPRRRGRPSTRQPSLRARSPGFLVGVFQAMAAVILAVFLCASLIPETAADPLIYHLAMPWSFVMQHRVVSVTQMFHASLPMSAPMHYGWMLLTAGEPAIRAWRWWILVAVGWTIHRLAAREGRPDAGWIAAAVFLCLPQTVWTGTGIFVDIEVCLLGLLAVLAIRRGGGKLVRRSAMWTTLAALLGAAGCAVKYQGVFLLPGFLLAGPRGAFPRRAAVIAAAVVLILAPWWVRNEIVMGNPVFPFAPGAFRAFRPIMPANRALLARHTESRVLWGRGEALLFPWKTAKGMNEETRLGPVFLLSVPWLILAPPAGGFAAYAWIAGAAGAGWALVTHVSRYATVVWALLCVLIAGSLYARGPLRGFRAVVLAVFGLDVLVRVLPAFGTTWGSVAAGRLSPRQAWGQALPNSYAGIAAKADLVLPPNARILLVGDIRAAYWPRPAITHSPYDLQVAHEILMTSRTAAEAAKRFREAAGFLYVNDRESGRLKYTRDFPMLQFDARTERLAAGVWRVWMDEVIRAGDGVVWRVRRYPRTRGPWPAVPMTFDDAALRAAYGGETSLTYEGPGGTRTTFKIAPRVPR